MQIERFFADVVGQNRQTLPDYFAPNAQVFWHCTNECFTAEEFIHIIVTAYFNGMFEVVRHNMDRAAAHRYVKMLNRYHMAGFGTVFDPQP